MAEIIHVRQLPAIGYFNPRWFAPASFVRERNQEDDVWTQDDMASDEDIDAVNQADGTEQSLPEVHDWDIDHQLEELSVMSTRSTYLTLFHFAKGIYGTAARDYEQSCRLLRVLHELRAEMTTPLVEAGERDEHVQDIQNAVARRRGRPKKREIPNSTVRAAKPRTGAEMILSCDLCDGAHELSRCQDIGMRRNSPRSKCEAEKTSRKLQALHERGKNNRHSDHIQQKEARFVFREIDVSRGFRGKVFAMTIKREIVEDIVCVVRSVPVGGNSNEPRWAHEGRVMTMELNH
jgi:hypothetical protein